MLNTDIPGRWTCTNFCDIPTLNQIRQSPFHGNFAYIRTKLHDFFLCNFANLVINNRFNSIRLRKTPMLQMLYTAFEFIVCFQHDTQIIFNKRLILPFPSLKGWMHRKSRMNMGIKTSLSMRSASHASRKRAQSSSIASAV